MCYSSPGKLLRTLRRDPFPSERMEVSQAAKAQLPVALSQRPSCHGAAPEPEEVPKLLGTKAHLGTLPALCSYKDNVPPLHVVVAIAYLACIEDLEDSSKILFHFFTNGPEWSTRPLCNMANLTKIT